jgi:hypothetical protein
MHSVYLAETKQKMFQEKGAQCASQVPNDQHII